MPSIPVIMMYGGRRYSYRRKKEYEDEAGGTCSKYPGYSGTNVIISSAIPTLIVLHISTA